jgi:type IV pilus assembly protein PilQ
MPAANQAVAAEESARAGRANGLEQFSESQATRQFSGRPVTLQVRDTELADVFRLIGEASGFNIIMGEDVKGKVTLSLVDVPWDQALDVILNTKQLGAERQGSVLRIVTLANLTSQKQQELQAKIATENAAPRVTRVFPINYANIDDLQTTLSKFAGNSASASAASAGGAATGAATFVQADKRTNSLIIRDIPDNIERMKKLIELLDTQTPQVLIEAKVIEASESFTKNLGGGLGFGNRDVTTAKSPGFASFGGVNPVDPLFGAPGVFASGSTAASPGQFALSPSLSILGNDLRLNALIRFGESESKLRIVASPRTVVLNKETANILQSTPVLVTTSTVIAGVGTVPSETIQQANLSLNVSPTVTNEGSVLMNLTVARDLPQPVGTGKNGVGNRNMSTKVLVDSGNTLVIGGIYTLNSTSTSSGFPLLRKIPIIGWLFGEEINTNDKSELFFFITPRILNTKEAGIPG